MEFRLERYKEGGDYFSTSGQFSSCLESVLLRDWIECGILGKSYSATSKDVAKLTGSVLYSGNQLCNKAKEYAKEATLAEISRYNNLQLCIPFSESEIDLYDANSAEVHIFDDAIGVKRQKEKREKDYKKEQKTVQTDVIEVQNKAGGFEYITGGLGVKNWDIESALVCWFSRNYGNTKLPLVAITDGAKSIRLRLWRIFGAQVVIILDWFHLDKKVRELLSMIAQNKPQKKEILAFILPLLWKGKVQETLTYLREIKPRNADKHEELLQYLSKHESEIINYHKRKRAGKTIGSGRAEKGGDLVVAQRQKNKPIAWSEDGSHALAVLKAKALNNAKIAA